MNYSNTNGKLRCRTFVMFFSIYPTSGTPIYLVYNGVFGRFVVRM